MKTGLDLRIPAGLALAALLSPAAAALDWPSAPVPEGTRVSEVSPHMIYNGLDMHPQVFSSSSSQAQVVDFYRQRWGRKLVVNDVDGAKVIGHREGGYFITVQVRDFGGGSKGTIGVMKLPSAPVHPHLGRGVPMPSGTRVFNDIAYPDDPVPARTLGMVNGLSPRQNAAFYRERLPLDGWHQADDGKACKAEADTCVLSYERGNSKLMLVLSGTGGQSRLIMNMVGK